MRFQTLTSSTMFVLPRPSDDRRAQIEREEHWREVLAWCVDQFGPAELFRHDRENYNWKYFGLYQGKAPHCYDLMSGIYFKDLNKAFAFKLRWA